MTQKIDLSFTHDPNWIVRREKLWKPLEQSLLEDYKKSEVEAQKLYFMTGELVDTKISDAARLRWHPCATFEGWDHVFENIVFKPDVYEEYFYQSLSNLEGIFIDYKDEIVFWDYFHPEVYCSQVKSRVPVGRNKEHVIVEVNPHKIVSKLATNFFVFLTNSWWNETPKFVIRMEYFFSALPHLVWEKNKYRRMQPESLSERKFETLTMYLFDPEIINNKYVKSGGEVLSRLEFRDQLIERIEGFDELPEKLRKIWNEVKSRY